MSVKETQKDPIHRKEGKLKEEVRNWRGWGRVDHRPGVVPLSPEPPGGAWSCQHQILGSWPPELVLNQFVVTC